MSTYRKERLDEIQVLRGIAFIAVVYQHAIGGFINISADDATRVWMYGMLFLFVKFAVPAFVFITGMVLFYNYYEKVNYPVFLKKRILEILVPYSLWSVVYLLYHEDLTAFDVTNAKHVLRSLLTGTASYHLWFVVMIFPFYLLYPLLLRAFKKVQKWVKSRVSFILLMSALVAGYTFLMWLSSDFMYRIHYDGSYLQYVWIKLRDRNFLFYSFYFVLGGLAAVYLNKWRDYTRRYLPVHHVLFVMLYVYMGYQLVQLSGGYKVNIVYATSLKPSMFFYTAIQLITLYGVLYTITKRNFAHRLTSVLQFIGERSYGAYLIHALVLNYSLAWMNQLGIYRPPLGFSLLAVFFCTIASVGIVHLFGKLPYSHLLFGTTKKKKPDSTVQALSKAS